MALTRDQQNVFGRLAGQARSDVITGLQKKLNAGQGNKESINEALNIMSPTRQKRLGALEKQVEQTERVRELGFFEKIGKGIKETPERLARSEQFQTGKEILKESISPFGKPRTLAERKLGLKGGAVIAGFEAGKELLRPTAEAGGEVFGAGISAITPEPIKQFFQQQIQKPQVQQTIQRAGEIFEGLPEPVKVGLRTAGAAGEVFTAGELGALAKTPLKATIKKIPKLVAPIEKVAKPIGKAGLATAKVVAKAPKAVFVATPVGILGKTTGTSADIIKQAFKSGGDEQFKRALRGGISPEETLGDVKNALETVKSSRRTLYGEGFKKLQANKNTVNIEDVKNSFKDTLKENKITITTEGALDFSASKIRKTSQGVQEMQDTFKDITTWQDTTPEGLDILKQRIAEGWKGGTDTGLSDRIHTEFAKKIKTKIINEVPEYANMVKTYEKISNEIQEITKTLSLGDKTAKQTAINKLNQALRDNGELKQSMINMLETVSGKDIKSQLAGQALNPAVARGLAGVITGGGVVFGQLANPAFWAGLALASPRLIGEIAGFLGMSTKALKSGIDKLATLGKNLVKPKGIKKQLIKQEGVVSKKAPTKGLKPKLNKK